MLKADLHIHTKEDPQDSSIIHYSTHDIIDKAEDMGFDILAITNHNQIFRSKKVFDYAKKKGILLIKGCEASIEGRHVLILNSTRIPKTFDDLRRLRKEQNIVVIAPHPFFILPSCLRKKLIEYKELFDCIEYSFFFFPFINLNHRAVSFAKANNKPIVATSDVHEIKLFGYTYSLIDAKKELNSVLNALRENKVKIITKHIPLFDFIKIILGELGLRR